MPIYGELTKSVAALMAVHGQPLCEDADGPLFLYYAENMEGGVEPLSGDVVIGKMATLESTEVKLTISLLGESLGLMDRREVCNGQAMGWLEIYLKDDGTGESRKAYDDTAAMIDVTPCTCGKTHCVVEAHRSLDSAKETLGKFGLSGMLNAETMEISDIPGDAMYEQGIYARGALSSEAQAALASFISSCVVLRRSYARYE